MRVDARFFILAVHGSLAEEINDEEVNPDSKLYSKVVFISFYLTSGLDAVSN